MDIHNLKLDWVSSQALVGMEWDKHLLYTVPLLFALPFLNLGEQNELRLTLYPNDTQSNSDMLLMSWLNDTKLVQ